MLWLEWFWNTMELHNFPIKRELFVFTKGKIKSSFSREVQANPALPGCQKGQSCLPVPSHPALFLAVHSCHHHCARLAAVEPHGEAGQPANLAEKWATKQINSLVAAPQAVLTQGSQKKHAARAGSRQGDNMLSDWFKMMWTVGVGTEGSYRCWCWSRTVRSCFPQRVL